MISKRRKYKNEGCEGTIMLSNNKQLTVGQKSIEVATNFPSSPTLKDQRYLIFYHSYTLMMKEKMRKKIKPENHPV